jgi:hypothetical protein
MAYPPQFVPPQSSAPPAYPPVSAYPPVPGYPAQPPTYVIQPAPQPQRPAVIGMSASMTVTGSALWICALATGWLFAVAGQARLQASEDFDGQVLILLNRFSARLLDGLAIPLFGLPALAFIAVFLLLSGRRWAQLLYTVLGIGTVAWLAWWLHASPGWAVAPITYVVIAVGILWTPGALRWYGRDHS